LSRQQKVVYWLVDFTIPNFTSRFGRDRLDGKLLVASRQLWTLILEERVRSALIGPGYVKGTIKKTTGEIDFDQAISGVIFDPTELRPWEPLPLVNIISPEVIDPLTESSKAEIEGYVKRVMIARGNPLVEKKIAEVKPLATIPKVEYTATSKVKLEIRFTSGLAKARFTLGGVHRKIYAPFTDDLLKGRYDDANKVRILWVDKRELVSPSKQSLSEWSIIEQSSERSEPEDGFSQLTGEYKRTLDFIKANSSSYILL